MATIHTIYGNVSEADSTSVVDGSGGGGNDGGMEARFARIETRLDAIEKDTSSLKVDMAVVKSNYATKLDVSEARNSIVIWVVSAIFIAQLLPSLLKYFGVGP